jgi:hypothetical protein
LALEFLWAGRLDEARQQSMAVAEIIKSSGLHQFQIADSMTFFCAADLFQGRYEAVRTMAVGEVFQVDNPRRFIYGYMEGLLAILNEQYEFAFNDLTKWCEIFLAQANSMSAAPPWAFLGLVAYRTRQPEAARKYLEDALKASLVSQWDFSYSCCLAVLAQILAEQGDIEGGVTLYAVASHQPLIPASQYFEDLFGLSSGKAWDRRARVSVRPHRPCWRRFNAAKLLSSVRKRRLPPDGLVVCPTGI